MTDARGKQRWHMKLWLADVPVLSLILFKLCPAGGSVVRPEWRWRRCALIDGRDDA